jgi:N-methylhydantoinase A
MDAALSAPTLYMHSAGGVLPSDDAGRRPILLAFSGPAAGVLAGQRVLRDLDLPDGITLDMGGTSCDVCLIKDGRVREREQFDVEWGVPARVRSLDIGTVGAGGGSIAWRDDGGALRVGPRSAGALPGPACYGRGGEEPTVTDANLVLGILAEEGLLGGGLPLDLPAARAALGGLGGSFGIGPVEMAEAIHRGVGASMAQAVREITVRHGIDPRDCALIAFGGAGPQHATAVASELGMGTVVVPAHSSVLSALGLLGADVRTTATRTLLAGVSELASAAVEGVWSELEREATARLGDADARDVVVERWAGLRYRNQWHEVALPVAGSTETLVARFEAEHERRFGTRLGAAVEVVDVWVTAVIPRGLAAVVAGPEEPPGPRSPRERALHLDGAGAVPVLARAEVTGEPVPGPCLVEEGTTVTVVPAGAEVVQRAGHLILELPR